MARDGNKGVLEPLNRVSPQFLEGILLADRPIAPETIAAYRATGYRVLGGRPFVFKIGRPSRPLRRLHGRCGCWTSAFITAWNPLGTRTPDARRRQRGGAATARAQTEGKAGSLHPWLRRGPIRALAWRAERPRDRSFPDHGKVPGRPVQAECHRMDQRRCHPSPHHAAPLTDRPESDFTMG